MTERYLKLFEKTLNRFGREINVTIETRGSKGETLRHLILSPKSFRDGFSVDQILSDGEKRAAAIADFLTEVSLNENNCGVILDDPVTSLDDDWKRTFADCLAELAKNRQVIIFTHDLVFLYRIKERANELAVETSTHWIREENEHPGFIYLDNSPVCEKSFRSAQMARDCYSRAKDSSPVEQQALIQQGFGALRTSYEALVIFEIFNEVVARFEERLSIGRLNGVYLDPVIIREVIRGTETVSRYIDAHLHSDKFASTKPTPSDLLNEIENFEALRQAQKDIGKKAEKRKATEQSATAPIGTGDSSLEARQQDSRDKSSTN